MVAQPGFFDLEDRLARLSAKGDELERLSAVVDFELFRPELERAVPRSDRAKGGRPPFDHVVMFKVLILQTQNNLSDERTEFYLRDRLSWMRFFGLGLGDPVPDANTIWTFREALTKAGASEPLFALFDQALRAAGYLAMSGQSWLTASRSCVIDRQYSRRSRSFCQFERSSPPDRKYLYQKLAVKVPFLPAVQC